LFFCCTQTLILTASVIFVTVVVLRICLEQDLIPSGMGRREGKGKLLHRFQAKVLEDCQGKGTKHHLFVTPLLLGLSSQSANFR